MKIAIGADHRGFVLKEHLKEWLKNDGNEVLDVGTDGEDSVDYPDFARKVCREVQTSKVDRGILICGTGIGMSMVANKFKGIRAALVLNEFMAEMSARHNNANVLCLPANLVPEELAKKLVKIWLSTPFEGGRHERRIKKIAEIEKEGC